jgi:hypothetical protein
LPTKGLTAAEQAGIDIDPPPSDVEGTKDATQETQTEPSSPEHDDGFVTWTDAQVRLNNERQFNSHDEESDETTLQTGESI